MKNLFLTLLLSINLDAFAGSLDYNYFGLLNINAVLTGTVISIDLAKKIVTLRVEKVWCSTPNDKNKKLESERSFWDQITGFFSTKKVLSQNKFCTASQYEAHKVFQIKVGQPLEEWTNPGTSPVQDKFIHSIELEKIKITNQVNIALDRYNYLFAANEQVTKKLQILYEHKGKYPVETSQKEMIEHLFDADLFQVSINEFGLRKKFDLALFFQIADTKNLQDQNVFRMLNSLANASNDGKLPFSSREFCQAALTHYKSRNDLSNITDFVETIRHYKNANQGYQILLEGLNPTNESEEKLYKKIKWYYDNPLPANT